MSEPASETKSDRAPRSRHEYQPSPSLSLSLLGARGAEFTAAAVRALLRERPAGRTDGREPTDGWTDGRTDGRRGSERDAFRGLRTLYSWRSHGEPAR